MLKRLALLCLLVIGLLLIATVAMAQEAPPDEAAAVDVGEQVGAAAILAAIHFLSQPLVKIVDRVKKWFGITRGDLITLVAVLLGAGLAWTLNLDPFPALNSLVPEGLILRSFPAVVGYLVAGIWMAFRAGYLNDQQAALDRASLTVAPFVVDPD